jgi:hypothetical protein
MTCALISDEKFEQLYAFLYGEVLQTRIDRQPVKSETLDTDRAVDISDPSEQKALIKTLYRTYKAHRQQNGKPAEHDEEEWFFEFIEDSYRSICEKFGCSLVQYRCDIKDSRIEILASPVL